MRECDIQRALQKLYTAKCKLAKMAEQDGNQLKANRYWQQASGVRDAAIVLLLNDCLVDINLDL